jgi:hypothetical protein
MPQQLSLAAEPSAGVCGLNLRQLQLRSEKFSASPAQLISQALLNTFSSFR